MDDAVEVWLRVFCLVNSTLSLKHLEVFCCVALDLYTQAFFLHCLEGFPKLPVTGVSRNSSVPCHGIHVIPVSQAYISPSAVSVPPGEDCRISRVFRIEKLSCSIAPVAAVSLGVLFSPLLHPGGDRFFSGSGEGVFVVVGISIAVSGCTAGGIFSGRSDLCVGRCMTSAFRGKCGTGTAAGGAVDAC